MGDIIRESIERRRGFKSQREIRPSEIAETEDEYCRLGLGKYEFSVVVNNIVKRSRVDGE